jgi:hypothetical protein
MHLRLGGFREWPNGQMNKPSILATRSFLRAALSLYPCKQCSVLTFGQLAEPCRATSHYVSGDDWRGRKLWRAHPGKIRTPRLGDQGQLQGNYVPGVSPATQKWFDLYFPQVISTCSWSGRDTFPLLVDGACCRGHGSQPGPGQLSSSFIPFTATPARGSQLTSIAKRIDSGARTVSHDEILTLAGRQRT